MMDEKNYYVVVYDYYDVVQFLYGRLYIVRES